MDHLKAFEKLKFHCKIPIINDIMNHQIQENLKHFELKTRCEKCKMVRNYFISRSADHLETKKLLKY